ncbi:MAG: efflux RND transporter periplasmic adaptor subunit, partial [Candidatus Gastranaerophilales bacterium]|nr:efflux RND transporter periplasmic adaptor subunit [Candidatus Gastranaerophilales bacterium]
MRKKIILIISIIFGAIFVRFAISAFNTHMTKVGMQKVAMPEAVVQEVSSKSIIKSFEAPARVVSKYQVNVNARINGYLTKSYFKEGDYVQAGQVLFEIEPQEYEYAMQQAEAELESAKAMRIYYDKQCARYKQLVSQDYIAKSDYDNALAQRDSYRASYTRTLSAYRDAKRNLGYTKVKAPVSGRVGMITVTVGNYVTVNSGALTTLYSTDPIYVSFPLEANDYDELTRIDGSAGVHRKVEYIFSSGKKYPLTGVQDFYDNKVDESTGTIKVRATFKNINDQLIAGDYGRAVIYASKSDPSPVVPSKAIQDNQEGKYVYVLDKDNIPKLVYITVYGQDGDNSIIKTGLSIGDRVVVGGLQQVIPGRPVKIVSAETEIKHTQKTN